MASGYRWKQKAAKWAGALFLVLAGLICMGGKAGAENVFSLKGRLSGYQSVLLQWESDGENFVYQIQKAQKKNGPFTGLPVISGQVGEVSCYDYDVILGHTYYYKVVKMLDDQVVKESPVITIRIVLTAPLNVKAKKGKGTQVRLSWDKVEKAAGYVIYRSNVKEKGFKKIGESSKNEFTDNSVNGGAYYYKVAAVKKKEKSTASALSDIAAVYLKPNSPVLVGEYSGKKIKITWKKVEGAEVYYIYKNNGKGSYKKIGTTNKLYYWDKKVKKGKSYEYKVVAAYSRDGKTIKSKSSKVCKILAASIDPGQKMVALTFDDGPGRYTEDIVNCLRKNNGKATFFVLGCNVDSYKSAVKAADELGCEIANHSYDHSNLTKLSEKEIREQIICTDNKVRNVTGKAPSLVRTPGGAVSDTVKKNVGKPIVLWSIDTLDWKTRDRDKTVKAVMDHVKDGDIVLMHDIHKPTKEAACILIPKLRQQGYQLVTVSEMAKYRGYTLNKGEIYRSLRKK